MFPKLDHRQIERLARCGQRRHVKAGEVLFEQGEINTRFYALISGRLEVVRPTERGTEELVRLHEPGDFTGEVNILSGRRSLVRGRMREAGEVVAIDRDRLRQLVLADAELSELIMRAFILRRMALIAHRQGDVALVGSNHSAATLRLREFLTRNGHPHVYLDVEADPGVAELLERFRVGVEEIPVVIWEGRVLRRPSIEELADHLGLAAPIDPSAVRDVVVIGGGPSGLAAAVYAASEGLDVVVLEAEAPGGQAGSSSKIENYLGFPTGISGGALAGRAFTQAAKFGAEVSVARSAAALHCSRHPYHVAVARGGTIAARVVIIASGARYRKLQVPGIEQYENAGVYYAATHVEAQLCGGDGEVVVVGGGNSAGQAAVFLSQHVPHVHMLVRSDGLAESMSRYLIRRLEESPNITLHTRTEIESLEGEERLERVRWRNHRTGEVETHPIKHVFVMTGADPNSRWLDGCVQLDDRGFVKTGHDLLPDELQAAAWPMARSPYLLECSLPGVFAIGDVRSGSVKRVAAAVGEGSTCVQIIHRVLRE